MFDLKNFTDSSFQKKVNGGGLARIIRIQGLSQAKYKGIQRGFHSFLKISSMEPKHVGYPKGHGRYVGNQQQHSQKRH